ncbi:MAG: aminopeptidase [Phycisphaerales bacterium]|nr:aminopeptidase [Phycisphaerales bacterium]
MNDPRIQRLADVLVRYSTRVKKGDLVALIGEPVAMPLLSALYAACLRAGANPIWMPVSEELTEVLVTEGSDDQVRFTSPILLHTVQTVDVRISMWAERNTKNLSRFDPARTALLQQARRPILKTVMDRAASGSLRWCGTQFPTLASAQDAEMSLTQYEDFVFRAGLLHLPDPVAAWQQIHTRQERVREHLQGKKQLRFRAPSRDGNDGTDLTVDVSKSTWINCAGHENFPDGEVFAGPQGADGHVNYTFPAVYQGREVHGVRLRFKAGRVVDASATKNEDFLFKMLDQDAGARTMGEIAIGTNYEIQEFSRNTLFDEKIGGTFHAAVGAGYPESGSTNESGLHWDMVCDLRQGGTIEADGQVFHKDGQFTIPGWQS